MTKKESKLREKASRIPEIRQGKLKEGVDKYLRDIEPLDKESARSHRFAMLVQQLLGVEPGFVTTYCEGIEKDVRTTEVDMVQRGHVDNLFGNLVIEFEVDIKKKRDEAEGQLKKYVSFLWSNETPGSRRPYLGIATDGVGFITYTPVISDPAAKKVSPEDIELKVIEEVDWKNLEAYEVFYWLDKYFLRKEQLPPTSEEIVKDFGLKSHAFQTTSNELLALWLEIKSQNKFSVIYDSWDKYLLIVYGSEVAGDELFVRHTYLATLAKLMAWMRLSGSKSLPGEEQIIEILEGRYFRKQSIENFIEEDFFSWIVREPALEAGVGLTRRLFSLLNNYNLSELSEDVLKSLYQELVDPAARHDLGEFYTPDWLALMMVNQLIEENPEGSFLDPACGSGTFIYQVIHEKRKRLKNSTSTLKHIFESVCGVDIHPLAVIIAKTNFILALGGLVSKRTSPVTIPIYLANTIRLPERWTKTEKADYEVNINGRTIAIPEALLAEPKLYDQAIEHAKDFAHQNKGKAISKEKMLNYLDARGFPDLDNDKVLEKIYRVAKNLKEFMEEDKDTIWAFVLKNIYKPLFLKQRFDFVVGNPPWIAYRYFGAEYQKFLHKQITENYGLLSKRGELITHLEVAALFFVRAADLYLKLGGKIAFVMPRSLFSADQHSGLRSLTYHLASDPGKKLYFLNIWDLENVTPLFNVPSCVLFADKREPSTWSYPVAARVFSGRLPSKNANLSVAQEELEQEDVKVSHYTRGKRCFWATEEYVGKRGPSYYKDKFFQGATIVPRSFWFVEVETSPLGIDPNNPPVRTDSRATKVAKKPYKDVVLKGKIEGRFLYATLLSTDLLPFGHLDFRLVVLPIEPYEGKYRMLNISEAHELGFYDLREWLEKAQAAWEEKRKDKAKTMDIFQRLDRYHGLTRQSNLYKYSVIYPLASTYLCSSILKNNPVTFNINDQSLEVTNISLDHALYYYQTNNIKEAFYLASVLNSPKVDEIIKPLQARGAWGPHDIHKKVLEIPIPKYNPKNKKHTRLVSLGENCTGKVKKWLEEGGPGKIKSIGRLRGMVRELLKDELTEIDSLVKDILS